MKGVALNIGANTSDPGFRGPIYSDGSFEYVPILEVDPSVEAPTYRDLGLSFDIPSPHQDRVVHFDPEFPELNPGEAYTYGEGTPAKAGALQKLSAGDVLFFYATLDYHGEEPPSAEWVNPDWGAYIIGHFVLQREPLSREAFLELGSEERSVFENNAHVRRSEFDAEAIVLGDPDRSRLYDKAIPLSSPSEGTEPNDVVLDLSSDSGEQGWWRRLHRFDTEAVRRLISHSEDGGLPGRESSSKTPAPKEADTQTSPTLHSYVLKHDSGFAPNPFHGVCTLATCKPRIRRDAEVGDWVIGTSSKRYAEDGYYLVYAMKVTREPITFAEYHQTPEFEDKKPHGPDPEGWRGDNIYRPVEDGYEQVDNPSHGPSEVEHDLSTDRVLVSDRFLYLGREMLPLPDKLEFVANAGNPGRKNQFTEDEVDLFVGWLTRKAARLDLPWNEPIARPNDLDPDAGVDELGSCNPNETSNGD